MHEILAQVVTHLRGARRFRWHAVAAAWGIALLGWLIVFSLPDSYQARARVYVDTESVLKPLLSGLAVNTDVMSQVNIMSTVLLSRPNLEKVARETDLYLRASTPEAFESLIGSLPSRIGLQSGVRDNTYTLTYADKDRAMAQRVVQTLLNTFVEDTLGIKRADATSAQRFLEQQIRDYEKRLSEAENRLADFKKQNVGLMPGETGDYYTRLQTAMQNLEQLRAKYRLASERREELQKQLEGEEPTFGLVPGAGSRSGPASPYDAKIAEYQKRLDGLLLQYTDKHPDVIALRGTIAQLEEQKKSSAPPPASMSGGEAVDPARFALRALDINPVYQNMKIALSQTNVELVEDRSRIGELEREVSGLRGRVDTIPEVEAQLARLNRDYEVNRAQHSALLQRLESARLSEDVEQNSERVKFRIIEPPTVPLQPVGPKRGLFLTVVLMLSIAVGGGLAFLLDQLKPVFSSRGMLREITGLPVLGSVHRLPIAGAVALERRQNLWLIASLGLLALIYAVNMALVERLAPAARALLG